MAIGNTFADLWFLVFGGISQSADKRRIKYAAALERLRESVNEKAESIPPENRIDPDLQIAGQALNDAKYCVENEDVREMFANLIASTMDSEKCKQVHPAFSDTIKQLSPVDAKYLSVFKSDELYPICKYLIYTNSTTYHIALNNAFFKGKSEHSFAPLEDSAVSMDVLERLGIIYISYSELLSDKSRYKIFETCEFYSNLSEKLKNNERIEILEGITGLTDFGKALCSVCFSESKVIHVTAQQPTEWMK